MHSDLQDDLGRVSFSKISISPGLDPKLIELVRGLRGRRSLGGEKRGMGEGQLMVRCLKKRALGKQLRTARIGRGGWEVLGWDRLKAQQRLIRIC